MVYGDLQFFDIIVFAVIAVFLIYRLRRRKEHFFHGTINFPQ